MMAALTSAQMDLLNPYKNSHQRFETRWWIFPMSAMTVSSASSPGALSPNPMPIIQPRFAVLRQSEATITLDGSDSYEYPSESAYDSVSAYAWSISSGPGSIASGAASSSCVVNIPVSDTPTVVKLTVTDSSANTTDAYGRYVRPATTDKTLCRDLTLTGSYSTYGWTADLTVMGDLTNLVSGDPRNNIIAIEADTYWDGVMQNFNPLYPWRPSLRFVGFIEDFRQLEECGHYYAPIQAATSHRFLNRYQNPSERFYYDNTDFGADHWYVDPLRLVDVGWDTILDVTNYVQYFGNVYFWPETREIGPERFGRITANPVAMFGVLGDTVSLFGGLPICTAQNDLYLSQEPGLITWRQHGGPLTARGKAFDDSAGGPLTEEYLLSRTINYRQPEVSFLVLSGERTKYTESESPSAEAGAVTNQGRKVHMSGFAVTGGEELEWLVVDYLARFNRDYDIEIRAAMFPVLDLTAFLDVDFDDEQQTGATSILEIDDQFWVSAVTHRISFDAGTWETRAMMHQVAEQALGGH